ncbi:MAG: TlpA family protein disulfide reductase [Propioniciclava sp.]
MSRIAHGSALLAAVLLVSAVLAGCVAPTGVPPVTGPDSDSLPSARVNAEIPDCPETDLGSDGVAGGLPAMVLGCLGSDRQVNLAALRGTPMVINIWAQWCEPCRAEAPALARFAAAVDQAGVDQEVLVLGINFDDPDPEAALAFAAAADWSYPHVADPLKRTAGALGLTGIPVTLFVDADGVIVHRAAGAVDDEMLIELTARHLRVTV